MKVIVTGFEPFGGDPVNPTIAALESLRTDPPHIAGEPIELHTEVLPVEFAAAQQRTSALLDEHPDATVVIALGLATGRRQITPERVAINIADARIPDNSGAQPVDEPLEPAAPAAYFGTLPIKALVADLRAAGIPAAVSQTAGTYVCNAVFYRLMFDAAARPSLRAAGFIHVPHPADVPQSTIDEAVRQCVLTACSRLGQPDLQQSGGTEA